MHEGEEEEEEEESPPPPSPLTQVVSQVNQSQILQPSQRSGVTYISKRHSALFIQERLNSVDHCSKE